MIVKFLKLLFGKSKPKKVLRPQDIKHDPIIQDKKPYYMHSIINGKNI